jgi:hypothetical protein
MPKGHKSSHGYSTTSVFEGGLGYREIAEAMTAKGQKMNHSTARHVLVQALDKIAKGVCDAYGKTATDDDLKRIASDPRFQAGIYDMLRDK